MSESTLITEEIVRRAWDAFWDAGPSFTAAGSRHAMRAALEAVQGDIIEEFGASGRHPE